MKPLSVIVAQSNAKTGEFLTKSLYKHFRVVYTANNINELLHSIRKHRADVAIVDLELSDLSQIRQLTHQFSSTKIVCTHRLADEKMWAAALAAGAADCSSLFGEVLPAPRMVEASTLLEAVGLLQLLNTKQVELLRMWLDDRLELKEIAVKLEISFSAAAVRLHQITKLIE